MLFSSRATLRFTIVVLLVTSGITLLFVQYMKPSSNTAAAIMSIWLVLPNASWAAILARSSCYPERARSLQLTAVVTSAAGVLFLTDVNFLHPDPQGAIAVFMTPMLQAILSALVLVCLFLLSKLRNWRT